MSESFTLYKLIILYMLDKVDFPLTNSQISDFILNKGYTTYFKLQQALSELAESELIRVENSHNRTLYHLTEDGKQSIQYFSNNISRSIRDDVDEYLREKKYDLKNEVSVKADYYRNTSQEFSVRCQVLEGELPLIDLTLSVPSETEAEAIIANWQKKNQEVYAWIMANLL
ncbi:MAG: DUF4364 family protein [Bariatricus sp.]|nr:DUF4364 family protein [Bariatricus sp.]